MATQPFPGDDIIDSRDIIAYIDEKEDEIQTNNDEIEEIESEIAEKQAEIEALEEELELLDKADEDEAEEIDEAEKEIGKLEDEIVDLEGRRDTLKDEVEELEEDLQPYKDLAEQAEGYGDWRHGESLINEDYFQEYAEQMAYDIGAVDSAANWPNNHIDWEAAADELKSDYMTVTFAGIDYLMRC